MPKIILPFGDTWQQTCPLSLRRELRANVINIKVPNCIPCGPDRAHALFTWHTVGGYRGIQTHSSSVCNKEDPLASLGDPKVSSVNRNGVPFVMCSASSVYPVQTPMEKA